MRKKRLTGSRDLIYDEGSVNLTPLIDVVFVVLIMFIIVAPLLELDRVELASSVHREDKPQIQETSPIKIYVHENNSILFNSKIVSPEQLVELLKSAKQLNPNRTPQLFHKIKKLSWDISICKKCG